MTNFTPDWIKHAVIYQIFPDRFAKSAGCPKPGNIVPWESAPTYNNFMGGDLYGVIEKLDYLQDLGINTLYFNPIFQSASNHKYHTHDYYQVDPMLGGNAAFDALIEATNARDMKVILDGVFNHASRGFFQFNHILECGAESPYIDWFNVHEHPLNAYSGTPQYDCWWNIPALPKFNTNNPEVRAFIFDVAKHWIERGAAGWRLDVPYEIDDDSFWQDFRRVVKAANPEAWITGEIVGTADRWLQGDQFDGVTNYLLTAACMNFFAGDTLHPAILERNDIMSHQPASEDATQFAARVQDMLTRYPWAAVQAQLNPLDSHDMPRFLTIANGDQSALQLATVFQFCFPGAPTVYYGSEIGLAGGYDPECRKTFPWQAPHTWDYAQHQLTKDCTRLRNAHPALRTGTVETVFAQGSVFAMQRTLADTKLLILFNAGRTPITLDTTELDLPTSAPLLTVGQAPIGQRLASRSAAVWSV